MASKRQTTANRRNARRSTGPRTADGIHASSLNALKHGLRSQLTVIPGENEAEFRALFEAFAEEAAPESARDLAAVRKATACEWRLRRIAAIETEMFTQALQQPTEEPTIDNIEQIVERLAAQQAAPPQSPFATLAQRFLKGEIKHFSALTRYEASLNRQYNQAWRELDSRPEPGFREVYDPTEESEAESEPEPEPHYTVPTPEALVWKSATDRYAEAQLINPQPPSEATEAPIETSSSEPALETAQTKPIPESDTSAEPHRRDNLVPFPASNDLEHSEGEKDEEEETKDEENLLEPGA